MFLNHQLTAACIALLFIFAIEYEENSLLACSHWSLFMVCWPCYPIYCQEWHLGAYSWIISENVNFHTGWPNQNGTLRKWDYAKINNLIYTFFSRNVDAYGSCKITKKILNVASIALHYGHFISRSGRTDCAQFIWSD